MRLIAVILGLACLSVGVTLSPYTDLVIANKVVNLDGYSRSAVLAGSTEDSVSFPGPVITAWKGDKFSVNVINKLSDPNMLLSTSIVVHWHGIFQHHTNYADGVVGVNQCPISPGHSFLYEFAIENQAGTYWYHSHHSTQYCDGLRGPLIIYDKNDPFKNMYDYDDASTIITLADWYHIFAHEAPLIVFSNSTLINGKGRYAGGPPTPFSVITVMPNKRYRFRLVSLSCDPNYRFSIDGHEMTVIEVDGVNHKPLVVDSIQIFAGQRYSFILNANKPVSNYWIRANPNFGPVGFEDGMNTAILRYSGAPNIDPNTQSATSNPLLDVNLHPLDGVGAPGIPIPGAADVNLNLNMVFDFDVALKYLINGATFVPPSVPVLLQILSGAKSAQELLPAGNVFPLPPNKVIEISMPGGFPGSPHPFHLHGHTFHVIRPVGTTEYNFKDPVVRDSVNVGDASDNVTIRFKTDNAGPWMLHCHIDWHLELGLAVIFAEDIPSIQQVDPPDSWKELCPIYNSVPLQKW